jgi:hypothetical protein
MDLSTVLERSDLGYLRELLEEEELDLECFQVLKLSDLNELCIDDADRDPLMNLIDELNGGTQEGGLKGRTTPVSLVSSNFCEVCKVQCSNVDRGVRKSMKRKGKLACNIQMYVQYEIFDLGAFHACAVVVAGVKYVQLLPTILLWNKSNPTESTPMVIVPEEQPHQHHEHHLNDH